MPDRFWRRLVDIRPGETGVAITLAALHFVVLAAGNLLKPVRLSAFLDTAGAAAYPFALLATAVVVGVIMSLYARMAGRIRPSRLLPGTYLLFAASFVAFWLVLRLPSVDDYCDPCGMLSAPWAASAGFFVWAALFSVLALSQSWLLANLVLDARQAKRLVGFVGMGGIMGGIVGSWGAGMLVEVPEVGRVNIVLFATGLLIVAAGLVWVLLPYTPALAPARGAEAPTSRGAAAIVRDSPHLRAVATILLLTVLVSAIADQQLASAVEAHVARGEARTAFYGRYYAATSTAALLVQLLLTSVVLRRLGVGVALLLLPSAMLGATAGLLLAPGLAMAALVRGTDLSLRYSLDQSTRELLFLPVPAEFKARVKPFIDAAVQRGGKGLGALVVVVLLTWLKVPYQYLGVTALAAIGTWIWAAWRVRHEYVAAIKRMIRVRDVQVDELVVQHLDADTRRELADAVATGDAEARRFAAELLQVAAEGPAERRISRPLHYPSIADVGERAEQVRAQIAAGVTREEAEQFLSDPIPRVRAGAIAALLSHHDGEIRSLAEEALERLAATPGPDGANLRREAALAIATVPGSEAAARVLWRLLRDPAAAVRLAACAAAAQLAKREFVPLMLAALREPAMRDEVRAAIVPLAPLAAGAIGDALRDPQEPREIRVQAARVLAFAPGALTVALLSAALEDPDPEIRYHALKSLNRLRRDHPAATRVEAEVVERALARETACLAAVAAARNRFATLVAADGKGLLSAALRERESDALERIARALGLLYPLDDILHAHRAVASGDPTARTTGLELLDNVLSATHRRSILPLFEGAVPAADGGEIADPWLVTCAAFAAQREGVARGSAPALEVSMMSVLERAEFLRHLDFLSGVRTEYLAKIAALMSERSLGAGDTLVAEGEAPRYVDVVAAGRVAVRRGGEILLISSRGDSVGVLSVLDGKPSPYTAVTLEPTTVLSIGAEEFRDLRFDNTAIMLGLLRYLAGQVRELSGRARAAGVSKTTIV
jgi:ATP/ADP translocase